jgi:hypothetical protein
MMGLFGSSEASAQRRARRAAPSEASTHLSYDIGASTGSYNGLSYSEVTLGLNWYFWGRLAWRNAVFTRFGSQSDSVLGLDTSLRYSYDSQSEPGELGWTFFGGPGYRIASEKYSGAFIEGGAVIRFGGLSLGAGVKSLNYTNPGKAADGSDLPKSDTVIFIILAGGGAL